MTTPIKSKIIRRLRRLSSTMHNLAVDIDYFGGMSSEWKKHSIELNGASIMVEEWADGIKKDNGEWTAKN